MIRIVADRLEGHADQNLKYLILAVSCGQEVLDRLRFHMSAFSNDLPRERDKRVRPRPALARRTSGLRCEPRHSICGHIAPVRRSVLSRNLIGSRMEPPKKPRHSQRIPLIPKCAMSGAPRSLIERLGRDGQRVHLGLHPRKEQFSKWLPSLRSPPSVCRPPAVRRESRHTF